MDLDAKSAALVVLLAIAGCSGGTTDEHQPVGAAAPASEEEVRVPLLPSGGATHLVGAPGVLEVDGPCLYLRATNGMRTLPAFATANTRWSQGQLVVGERTFRPGQHVTLTGGPVRTLDPKLPWIQAPDARCDASGAFIAAAIEATAAN